MADNEDSQTDYDTQTGINSSVVNFLIGVIFFFRYLIWLRFIAWIYIFSIKILIRPKYKTEDGTTYDITVPDLPFKVDNKQKERVLFLEKPWHKHVNSLLIKFDRIIEKSEGIQDPQKAYSTLINWNPKIYLYGQIPKDPSMEITKVYNKTSSGLIHKLIMPFNYANFVIVSKKRDSNGYLEIGCCWIRGPLVGKLFSISHDFYFNQLGTKKAQEYKFVPISIHIPGSITTLLAKVLVYGSFGSFIIYVLNYFLNNLSLLQTKLTSFIDSLK